MYTGLSIGNPKRRKGAVRLRQKNPNTKLFSKKSAFSYRVKEYAIIAILGFITLFALWWLYLQFSPILAEQRTANTPTSTSINAAKEVNNSTKNDDDVYASESERDRNTLTDSIQQTATVKKFSRAEIAENLNFPAGLNDYPDKVHFHTDNFDGIMNIEYTLNKPLQNQINEWLLRYNSDFSAVAVIDVETGKIKAISSHVADGTPHHNLAVNAYYPGASVFKIVTAAAAIDEGLLNPNSIIPFNGRSTTLYKNQVLAHKNNSNTRTPSLTESFAKSINPVFGRIGANVLGFEKMQKYGRSFGFNRRFRTDITVTPSLLMLDPEDEWSLVEAGSGYTQDTLLSPLHGALLASTIANGGMLKLPYWVVDAKDGDGVSWYQGSSVDIEQIIKPSTAEAMKVLMRETVDTGTARKSFRQFKIKAEQNGIDIGGKTGTLRGRGPNNELKGLHDWFVGYAGKGDDKIAFAILNVSKDKWQVKSHYMAKQLIEYYYFDMPKPEEMKVEANVIKDASGNIITEKQISVSDTSQINTDSN